MIKLDNVSKTIKPKKVLDDISYTFNEGMVYGLYGENGSGKTMLMRAISGLISIDEGQISVNGDVLHKDIFYPKSIGIVIENMELLPRYSAFDNLKLISRIKKAASDSDITRSLERVGLAPTSKEKVKKYSLGMKQRLNIAQAIFEKPDIILLDEPTNALDENGVELIYQLILEEKRRGAVIIVATHHKDDIAALCDETLRVSGGSLRAEMAQGKGAAK
jgi:ABC-2 type transport system ATP-binding protein